MTTKNVWLWACLALLMGMPALAQTEEGTYEGRKKNDLPHGYGTFTWKNGRKYTGYWQHGLMEGEGSMYYENGDRYQGGWKAGAKDGAGNYVWKDGTVYSGSYQNGLMHGWGRLAKPDGEWHEGYWKEGLAEGMGTHEWPNGGGYKGQWKAGKRHGRGAMEYPDGGIEQGDWADDKFLPCQCNTEMLAEEAFEKADIVFAGIVEAINLADDGKDKISFEVTQLWKGTPHLQRRAVLIADASSCDLVFFQGGSYLIYATKDGEGFLQTTKCMRSEQMAKRLLDLGKLDALAVCQGEVGPSAPGADYTTDPVCGCDGKTYNNADEAKKKGIKAWKKGKCD